jgi:hypothetical protein
MLPKLEKFEAQLEEKVEKKLPVRINYDFAKHEDFTSKPLSDQSMNGNVEWMGMLNGWEC